MKHLKKIFIISIVVVLSISGTCGCSRINNHNTPVASTQMPIKESKESKATLSQDDEKALLNSLAVTNAQSKKTVSENVKIPDEFQGENVITKGTGYYHCDFEKDRNYVKSHGIDITMGDNLYMTQINDWFTNFDDYNGKTVEIEGYYINFDPYSFVGRYGPTCPYCTGGFVDFEFLSDQDISDYKGSQTWIKVDGILRKGYDTGVAGEFYYIEATSIEVQDKVGEDTVKN